MIHLTKEQQEQALQKYRALRAQINQENQTLKTTRQTHNNTIKKRSAPRIVTPTKRHLCSVCGETIIEQQKAWYTPGRIAAKSSRCSDPAFTQSKYTCLRCKPAEANKP